jgi:hypothetical protein
MKNYKSLTMSNSEYRDHIGSANSDLLLIERSAAYFGYLGVINGKTI